MTWLPFRCNGRRWVVDTGRVMMPSGHAISAGAGAHASLHRLASTLMAMAAAAADAIIQRCRCTDCTRGLGSLTCGPPIHAGGHALGPHTSVPMHPLPKFGSRTGRSGWIVPLEREQPDRLGLAGGDGLTAPRFGHLGKKPPSGCVVSSTSGQTSQSIVTVPSKLRV